MFLIATASKKEITTLRSSSFQSVVTRKTSDQTTTQTQRNQSSPLETINITQLMETDNDTASFWRSMKKETGTITNIFTEQINFIYNLTHLQ